MTLEDQVCSLEPSKRLEQLGVKQESLFWWLADRRGNYVDYLYGDTLPARAFDEPSLVCSAFTVAELGALLGEVEPDVLQMAYNFVFNVEGSRFITSTGLQIILTNPDLCAKILVYLLENDLIKSV